MARTAMINARTEKELKEEVELILKNLGLFYRIDNTYVMETLAPY